MTMHEMELALERLRLAELSLDAQQKTQADEVTHWTQEQLRLAAQYQQQIGRYRKIAPMDAAGRYWKIV